MTTSVVERSLRTVVRQAYREPFTIQSNFAQKHAEFVAMAASKGLITTQIKRDLFGRHWRVTVLGLQWLNQATEG